MIPPTDVQQQRAKQDLQLLEIEQRLEEVRQLKIYEPWRLIFSGLAIGAALIAAGVAIGHWICK